MKKLLIILFLLPFGLNAQMLLVNGWKQSHAFSPKDISGMAFWVDADSIAGKSNGDTLQRWRDLSGNGYDALENTEVGKEPTYATSVLNGKPVVHFTRANLTYMRAAIGAISNPYTVLIVTRSGVSAVNQYFYDGGTSNSGVLFNGGVNTDFGMYQGNILSTSATTSNWHIVTSLFNGAGSLINVDGGADVTGSTGTGTTGITNFSIGVDGGFFATNLDGDIYAIVIYSGDIGSTARTNLLNYYKAKTGL